MAGKSCNSDVCPSYVRSCVVMVLYGDVGWWRGHGMEEHGKVM